MDALFLVPCRDAKIQFLKYAAPLLHLSGMDVTVVEVSGSLSSNTSVVSCRGVRCSSQSEYEGQIRTLLGYIHPETDVIVVAGGDGTLLEVRKTPSGVLLLLIQIRTSMEG